MAKSTTKTPRSPVPISTGTAIAEPPEQEPPDIHDAPPAEAPPPAETPAPATPPRTLTFFEKQNRIHKDDWGPRANIYLYRTEPMIDRTRGGEKKYVQCYAEPIGEERILIDHGSGRYKAILNFKKPGAERGDEIDAHFFDIQNLNFPPKVPEGDWIDDPKNKRWSWARKVTPPPAPAAVPMSGMAEAATTLETLVNISERMAEKAKPAPVAAAAAPPAAADPFDTAKKIMDMRTNDPMITLLLARMDAQDKAMEAARAREFELQKELREKASAPAAAAPAQKDFLTQLIDFGGEALKTKLVSSLFGGAGAAAEAAAPARAGRMNTLEFISDFGPKALQTLAPLIDAAAHKIMNPANGAAPATNGNPSAMQTQQVRRADPFQDFIRNVVNETMLTYFNADPSAEGGEGYADWIYAGYPQYFAQLQNFEHPAMPGLKGAAAIITGYKNTPHIWNQIGPAREVQFAEFVNGFCAWKAESSDEDVQDAEVITGEMEEGYDAPEGEGRVS